MTGIKLKKLEMQQLSQKLTKKTETVEFKWRYRVVERSDFKKSSFIEKFKSYSFELIVRKISVTQQWRSGGLFPETF